MLRSPRDAPDLRVHVSQSAVRCPYCHDEVETARNDWTACRSCLARHHAPCWRESSGCASCGEASALLQPGSRESALGVEKVKRELGRIDAELARARGSWGLLDFVTRAARGIFHALCMIGFGWAWYAVAPTYDLPRWFVLLGLVFMGMGALQLVESVLHARRALLAQARLEVALLKATSDRVLPPRADGPHA